MLDDSRVNPRQHSDIVAQFCVAYAEYAAAAQDVQERGVVVRVGARKEGEEWVGGRVVANPMIGVRDNAARTMLEIGKTMGLQPDIVLPRLSHWDDYAATLLGDGNAGTEAKAR